ncbi:hypothetical protein EJG51_010745 [Undibacterium piscinae]|uniref:Uncharacterized protein n=1 Tax=Undibacterium piscinae TaxID=2495591 RepID=A0A6M4A4G1_9BURK|nr:hypothetical protein EJG51_010745 [Undibacterium piscinae]
MHKPRWFILLDAGRQSRCARARINAGFIRISAAIAAGICMRTITLR